MVTDRTSYTAASTNASVVSVYILSLILSACSLLYELLIAQTLTLIAGNMVIWYSLTVGMYLGAMGVGAIVYGSPDRSRDWGRLYRVEIMLSLIGASAVLLLNFAHSTYLIFESIPTAERIATFAFFGFSFTLTFLIGILTGMELPLLIHLGNELAGGRNVTNRVLGWDYIGALAGGVGFPLYMVPFLELHTIGFLIAALNLLVAVYILWRFLARAPGIIFKTAGSVAFGVVLFLGYFASPQIEQFFLKKYYYYPDSFTGLDALFDSMDDMPRVFRESSPYQKIDIVHIPNNSDDFIEAYSTKFALNDSIPDNYFLFLNGDFQFASNHEELYHEWFTHVPIIINSKVPKRVLVMGGGDGLIHRELIKYDGVESITHVDIDRNLVTLATIHPVLTAINGNSFDDPRVRTIFGDAFQYLREYTGEPYDAIYMDFPDVMDYNLSKLYSREYFHFVRLRLKDDGFAALDTPGVYYGVPDETNGLPRKHRGSWAIHSNTMRLAGFKTVLPFYSILEIDNPTAYERLSGQHPQVTTGQDRDWRTEYLKEFSEDMQQGFMLLRKDERYGPFEYIDFGIELHVLNEKRFKLSHPDPPKPTDQVDFSEVNSILRPTLPDGMMWYIRSAW